MTTPKPSMEDQALIKEIADGMKKQVDMSDPGGEANFLPYTTQEEGVLTLLDVCFGTAGEADAQRRLGIETAALGCYLMLFTVATRELELSDQDLQSLAKRLGLKVDS